MKLIDEEITKYLADSLSLNSMSAENRNEVLTKVLEVISEKAVLKILDNSDIKAIENFNKIPKDDMEKMEEFLMEYNSNSKKIFFETAKEIVNAMLEIKPDIQY